MTFFEQTVITTESKMNVEPYTRFSIWDGERPVGQYITRDLIMSSENYYFIEELVEHSDDGINLDYETTHIVTEGFVKENGEEILKIIESGEDGYVQGKYIKIFAPKFPSLKEWNHKYRECNEKWVTADEFQEQILDHLGEATYEKVLDAIKDGKTIEWRYLACEHYTDSIFQSSGGCPYIQLFADGQNLGWTEDHPHREYKKLEDGRTIAIGEPTVYYDILLAHDVGKWKFKTHRIGSLHCWIKETN